MNESVSFVVPTLNSARTLERCQRSIREQHHHRVEIIVVDNDSIDATPEIARRLADQVLVCGPERSAQRNAGWRAASGDIVAFIDSDMVLEPQIAGEAIAVLSRVGAGAAIIPERAFGEGYLARCRAFEKDLYLGDERVEAARLYTRAALEATGGFDETLTAFEDWDLSDRTRAAGFGIERIRSTIWHDEGRIRLSETYRRKRYYGQWFAQYRNDPRRIRSLSRWGLVGRVLGSGRPLLAAGVLALKATEAAGLYAGGRSPKPTSSSHEVYRSDRGRLSQGDPQEATAP